MIESKTYTVSEITGTIKRVLEKDFANITIRGEISNLTNHSSGHRYFTLKDDSAQISCTLWKSRPVRFALTNGMKVIIRGDLTVYPPSGKYQIDVASVVPEGQGDLYLAYEALKAKLGAAGYFDQDRKKILPDFIQSVAIITSPTGAVIEDMKKTIARRFPLVKIYFRPAKVQGDGSAEDIALAIYQMQKQPVDVIIVGRGGGSMEDLWAFNMEEVADAIFNSRLPVISAVGHETDFTISDFVADLRAATPTAAAEIVTPNTTADYLNYIENKIELMQECIKSRILDNRYEIDTFLNSYSVRKFIDKIRQNQQLIDELELSIKNSAGRSIKNLSQNVVMLESHLLSLNPDNPLKKGYAILRDETGKVITNLEKLTIDQNLVIQRQKQSVLTKIIDDKYTG